MFGRKLSNDELNPASSVGGRQLEPPTSTMSYHLAGPIEPIIPGCQVTEISEPTELGCRVFTAPQQLERSS
jgi:hypothetical protein